MGKAFFDVFPTLRVNRQLSELFAETQVEKLTTDRMRTALRIRLSSRHLIHRRYADEMQREIARQVLKDTGRKVLITERYELSSQYTPRHLMDAYRDSIAYEINGFSPVLGRVFREAKISYPDGGHVVLTLHDNCFARDGEERLLKGLTSIFEERCGVPAVMSDERLTTVEADETMDSLGIEMARSQVAYSVRRQSTSGACERKRRCRCPCPRRTMRQTIRRTIRRITCRTMSRTRRRAEDILPPERRSTCHGTMRDRRGKAFLHKRRMLPRQRRLQKLPRQRREKIPAERAPARRRAEAGEACP